MVAPSFRLALTGALLLSSLPATAQLGQSQSYQFLQAVKDAKGEEVTKMLDKPGTTIINTHDFTTGEGALHIIVKRNDATYLRFLLQRGADPNIRDGKGNSPMMIAATLGAPEMIDILITAKANVNLGNSSGETPLIRAVQRRDMSMVRVLLAAGADPDQRDLLSGQSARDYAHSDSRSPAIAKLIDETPKKAAKVLNGPKL